MQFLCMLGRKAVQKATCRMPAWNRTTMTQALHNKVKIS